ncbi:hypothetical protein [Auraticoccus monumenti]|uniref:Uncharacterized protein n=1 Tax=Auraticoccus monumenti TaxID=675864 RepID=A0A1G6UPM9_9ACTN|nr:hypothetical protein [Auraticoccus monumenti]SDD43243.1 hypothetical protein SAMN04489747_0936 [Auraticoccus monumenti]
MERTHYELAREALRQSPLSPDAYAITAATLAVVDALQTAPAVVGSSPADQLVDAGAEKGAVQA